MSGVPAYQVPAEVSALVDLQNRVPPVGDKLLIDLVNGLQVSRDILRFRRRRGFFGRLLDGVTGATASRQEVLDGNLVTGLDAVYSWVLELTDTLRINESALVYTQRSLLEAREKVRQHSSKLRQLDERLDALAQAVSKRISEVERRLTQLEQRHAARDHVDVALAAWEAGRTYQGFPWLLQVALLTHEVWSGPAGLVVEEASKLTSYFVDRVLVHGGGRPEPAFSILSLLDLQWSQVADADRQLACALFDPDSLPDAEISPMLELMGMTGEYLALPREERPERPARLAYALQRQRRGPLVLPRTTDPRRLLEQLSRETLTGLQILRRRGVLLLEGRDEK
jgi:hypothetical protein